MKKKVIIGYTNTKSEEKRVSKELYDYLINIKSLDVELLDFSSCFNNEEKTNNIKLFFNKIFHNNVKLNISKIREDIDNIKPDIIITTNTYIDCLINNYNSQYNKNIKVISIICEISLDSFNKNISKAEYYVVNNRVIKNKLLKANIPSKKIIIGGTPTFNIDNINLEQKELTLKKYSLDNTKPVYLIISNGHDYFFEYFKALAKKNFNINIIFISSKNKKLYDKSINYIHENNIKNVLVLGFIKDLYNLYNVSNVVITNPGTSTLIECMNFKKTTILLPSTNLEERKNLSFMIKNHLSIKVTTPLDLIKKVKLTLNYKFLSKSIQNRLNKLNIYNSCKIIEDLINKL